NIKLDNQMLDNHVSSCKETRQQLHIKLECTNICSQPDWRLVEKSDMMSCPTLNGVG
ncbi:unnamed protein product, partial [Schistosoma curassoni]